MSEEEENLPAGKAGKNIVNEPQTEYVSKPKLGDVYKTITISSFEDMEDERRKYSASLSPIQRMAYLYELNQLAFGHIFKQGDQSFWTKEIIIEDKP